MTEFKLEPPRLTNFVLACREKYNDNPFHNWHHGFSVLQYVYASLKNTDALHYLQAQDVLALLVASLCHDIDHPGVTNAFEINSGSTRALLYNDISVLENHHAYTLFTVLHAPRCDIVGHLPRDTRAKLRKTIIQSVLSTDMSNHFDFLRSVDSQKVLSDRALSRLEARGVLNPNRLRFDAGNEKDRQMVMDMLIHTADLSGQVYPWSVASEWEVRIATEFGKQAEVETGLGFAPLPHMNRMLQTAHRYQMQVNFIDFVLRPWWKAMARVFPPLSECLTQLKSNRNTFSERAVSRNPESYQDFKPLITQSRPPILTIPPFGDEGDASFSQLPEQERRNCISADMLSFSPDGSVRSSPRNASPPGSHEPRGVSPYGSSPKRGPKGAPYGSSPAGPLVKSVSPKFGSRKRRSLSPLREAHMSLPASRSSLLIPGTSSQETSTPALTRSSSATTVTSNPKSRSLFAKFKSQVASTLKPRKSSTSSVSDTFSHSPLGPSLSAPAESPPFLQSEPPALPLKESGSGSTS
jgi:hypothetical protein